MGCLIRGFLFVLEAPDGEFFKFFLGIFHVFGSTKYQGLKLRLVKYCLPYSFLNFHNLNFADILNLSRALRRLLRILIMTNGFKIYEATHNKYYGLCELTDPPKF